MAWIWLFLAGLAEIVWMVAMKFSDGFRQLGWAAITVAAMGISVLLTSFAVRSIPMGTAYAVWTGIGAAGISMVGMIWFGEPRTAFRVACIVLIVAGIVGLRIASDA